MTGADTLKAVEVMNPKRRDMSRLEDDAEQRIAAALDKWRRDLTRGMTADNAPFIVSRLQQRDVYQPFYDAIIAVLRDLALAGAGFGREQIEQAIYGTRKGLFDVVWDLVNAAAEAWARQFGGQLIRGITETTRQRVAATVADWTTNDEGLYALTQRLAEPSGPFGQSRARTIAVTETTRAYAEGNRAAWRESNVVTRRRWNTNVDEAVCPICGPLHNVVVGLEESYPGGIDGPPAHPNCRCWVTPVVPGAEERETGLEQFGLGRPVTAPPPTAYQAFNDIKRAEAWAVENKLARVVDYSGVDPDAADIINRVVYSEFGNNSPITEIKTRTRAGRGVMMQVDMRTKTLEVSSQARSVKVVNQLLEEQDEIWFMRGNKNAAMVARNYEELVIHEIGHLKDAAMWDKKPLGKYWYAAQVGNNPKYPSAIGKVAKRHARELSEYATTNIYEYFAEAYTAYKTGRLELIPDYLIPIIEEAL